MRSKESARAPYSRTAEAEDFVNLVFDRTIRVVVLSGPSGVGKTSMLNLDLRPQLQQAGYRVLICDEWTRSDDRIDANALIGAAIDSQLPAGVWIDDDRPPFAAQLDEYYPGSAVVILDQFEELMRYQPELCQSVFEWIRTVATTTRVTVVISLRVEYEHQLSGHTGLRLGPFQQARFALKPLVDNEAVSTIIQAGAANEEYISASAASALLKHWQNSGAIEGTSEIGLLHLQAVLYTLWMTREAGESRIETRGVEDLASAAESAAVPFFQHGLAASVAVALKHCQDASAPNGSWPGLEGSISTRAAQLVAAMSGHLASGGYKVSLDRDQLARAVLFGAADDEALQHRFGELAIPASMSLAERVDRAARALREGHEPEDWLNVTRSALLGESGPPKGDPWDLDPDELTGGWLLGLRPVDTFIEEYRSFHLALEWLRTCDLVRMTSPGPQTTMVSLIHDRFASGLRRWRRTVRSGPREATNALAAIRGAQMDWLSSTLSPPTDQQGEAGYRASESGDHEVVVNARWRSCTIRYDFKRVTFVNCDFRGSQFLDCSFEGVAFVNCLLDDVEFRQCSFIGTPSALPTNLTEKQKTTPPAFLLDLEEVGPELLHIMSSYRELPRADGPVRLLSSRAGLPAVPSSATSHPREIEFAWQTGGLTMYGGHLSSLKVRSCDFERGALSLRHVAGSSVELAEQSAADLEIFAAALRGLTVTRPLELLESGTESNSPADNYSFRILDSRVINVWFGPGVSGDALFQNCIVWQLFNGSEDLFVNLPQSPLLGVVNVQPFESWQERIVQAGTLEGIEDQVLRASELIDYRTNPARYEESKHQDDD
jgi:hypothetical protein